MRFFNRYLAFLVIVLGFSSHCFALQNAHKIPNESQNDNYYVQPGGVYVAPDAIFISLDGRMVQVNTICSDALGVFVPYEEMSRRFIRCTLCGNWFDPDRPQDHDCKGY